MKRRHLLRRSYANGHSIVAWIDYPEGSPPVMRVRFDRSEPLSMPVRSARHVFRILAEFAEEVRSG